MKTKQPTKHKTKKKRVWKGPNPIPKSLKKRVVKRFRDRHHRGQVIVVLKEPIGVSVAKVLAQEPTTLRKFVAQKASVLPTGMEQTVQTQLAIWYARWIARHPQIPSVRQERSRRKRIVKRLVRARQVHDIAKADLQASNIVRKTKPKTVVPIQLNTFVCVYNPRRHRRKKQTFAMHTAGCGRIDSDRRSAHRWDGDSWVIESKTMFEAMKLQLAEFDEGDMGYDSTDFEFHDCGRQGR